MQTYNTIFDVVIDLGLQQGVRLSLTFFDIFISYTLERFSFRSAAASRLVIDLPVRPSIIPSVYLTKRGDKIYMPLP